MGPYVVVAQGMMREAVQEKVLEETHILQREKGNLLCGL